MRDAYPLPQSTPLPLKPLCDSGFPFPMHLGGSLARLFTHRRRQGISACDEGQRNAGYHHGENQEGAYAYELRVELTCIMHR